MAKQNGRKTLQPRQISKTTSEPCETRPQVSTPPIFVIQKHQARHLHYDLRLEVNDSLKSWAVPKGPSTDPRHKRLAISTEDHALAYADFEGVIPEGRYGAGTVLVWDRGTYRNLNQHNGIEVSMDDALASGYVKIWLDGQKLTGGYTLRRFRKRRGKEQWLWVKMADETADARQCIVSTAPHSVLSGRTIEDIAAGAP